MLIELIFNFEGEYKKIIDKHVLIVGYWFDDLTKNDKSNINKNKFRGSNSDISNGRIILVVIIVAVDWIIV